RYRNQRSVFGYQVAGDGAITGAVMRTPPHALLASPLAADEIEPLLDAWLPLDPYLNGVNGPPETARGLTQAWVGRTGGRVRLAREMAMHSLRSVVAPPRPAAGRLRRGEPAERELLIDWWQAVIEQAGGHGGGKAAAMSRPGWPTDRCSSGIRMVRFQWWRPRRWWTAWCVSAPCTHRQSSDATGMRGRP